MGIEFEEIIIPGYERVLKVSDPSVNLLGIIAIHNTTLGPALGGTRIFPYATFDDALTDVLRLSKGMTYKSAMADVGFGGGKSVIIADPKKTKTRELLLKWGEALEVLGGAYIGAEDSGCALEDIGIVSERTRYVVGIDHEGSSGNPSPFTSFGTFRGVEAACSFLYQDSSLKGKKVAIQGLGSVGLDLAHRLFWAGAELIVADTDPEKVKRATIEWGAKASTPDDILFEECDILAPCAFGGILNKHTIPKLRCHAVAGCANNQLLKEKDAELLLKRGILYAPDYVINAGGLVNVATELLSEGYHPLVARDKTDQVFEWLLGIFRMAKKNACSTHSTANSLAEYRIKYKIGKREVEPTFHHALAKRP